jgi:hypothetical protein
MQLHLGFGPLMDREHLPGEQVQPAEGMTADTVVDL